MRIREITISDPNTSNSQAWIDLYPRTGSGDMQFVAAYNVGANVCVAVVEDTTQQMTSYPLLLVNVTATQAEQASGARALGVVTFTSGRYIVFE